MQKTAEGDQRSFEELYGLWARRVMAFAYRSIGDLEESRDIVQDTFVQLFKAAKSYKPEGKFASFVMTIASNLIRMRYRRQRPSSSLDDIEEETNELPNVLWDTPEDRLIESLDVGAALESLQPRQRIAMELIADGASYSKGAEIMGISREAFAQLILRGRRALRSIMKRDER